MAATIAPPSGLSFNNQSRTVQAVAEIRMVAQRDEHTCIQRLPGWPARILDKQPADTGRVGPPLHQLRCRVSTPASTDFGKIEAVEPALAAEEDPITSVWRPARSSDGLEVEMNAAEDPSPGEAITHQAVWVTRLVAAQADQVVLSFTVLPG